MNSPSNGSHSNVPPSIGSPSTGYHITGIQWDQVLQWVENWPNTPYKDYVESVVVRFGVPDQYRGVFWQRMSHSTPMKNRNEGLYKKLLLSPSLYQKNIEADVHRSFPNATIKDAVDTPEKLASLYNVLHAYSVLDKLVSYCQGMNYMVAVLLMFMEEEDAFWVLVNIMFHYGMSGLYRDDTAVLANYLNLFHECARQHYPRLINHFDEQGYVPHMYVTEWFTTLFVYRLPLVTVVRIWDFFFTCGQEGLFKIGLALLAHCDDLIGVAMEPLADRMKQKLASLTPEQIIPRAYAIIIPEEVKRLLVDADISKQYAPGVSAGSGAGEVGGGSKRRFSSRRFRQSNNHTHSCTVQ